MQVAEENSFRNLMEDSEEEEEGGAGSSTEEPPPAPPAQPPSQNTQAGEGFSAYELERRQTEGPTLCPDSTENRCIR